MARAFPRVTCRTSSSASGAARTSRGGFQARAWVCRGRGGSWSSTAARYWSKARSARGRRSPCGCRSTLQNPRKATQPVCLDRCAACSRDGWRAAHGAAKMGLDGKPLALRPGRIRGRRARLQPQCATVHGPHRRHGHDPRHVGSPVQPVLAGVVRARAWSSALRSAHPRDRVRRLASGDRIGRKASFILGDGAGAVISLLNVLIVDPVFLLLTPVVSSMAGNLHHVSETAFMAENSTQRERVHLFSVGGSLSTAVGIVGSLIAASFPAFVLWFGSQLNAYRAATLIGIALWFLSLIPALMLREERGPTTTAGKVKIGLGSIKHPAMVARLVTTGALLSVGYGAALPFMNVFFHEHLHADESEIGTTFATAALFVAVGGLFAPLIASRLGKVRGITIARLAAVPVVLSLGLSPETQGEVTIGLTAAGLAIALRSMLMNVSVPIAEAFAMEVLDPSERATMVGLETAAASLLRAGAVVVASMAIANNDFLLPFAVTAACYLLSTGLFWVWFRGYESPVVSSAIVAPSWQT